MSLKTKSVPRTTNKDINKLLQLANDQGWNFKEKKKHIMAYPPDRSKGMVLIAVTTGGGRADRTYQNVKSEMKKRGLKI